MFCGDIDQLAKKAGMTVVDYLIDQHHNKGKSLYSLAQKVDVSTDYLKKIFHKLGIEFRPQKPNTTFNGRRTWKT